MLNTTVIYIQNGAKGRIEIAFPSEKAHELTCHWLLEQTVSKLKQVFPDQENFDNIATLCTVSREYAVDHWLNFPYRSISVLKSGTVLYPFYRQTSKAKEDGSTKKISLDDFSVEIKLGFGAFSKVYLVRKKDTGVLYALKQLPLANLKENKRKMILRERQAMLDLSHSSHIVPLRYAFQTENYCYFVLDFIPCGDMHRVAKQRVLTEREARFYVAEVILGLNDIHREHYIYRDLKPENILLDLDGHIRITDFGLAKKVESSKSLNYTFCGTSEIMAPEVTRGDGYDFMVDYYNIGTLAYELVTGKVPMFNDDDRSFCEEKNPQFQDLSEDFKHFLKQLFKTKAQSRLGFKKGLNELCAHPWLSTVNLAQLNERNIKPPLMFDPNSIVFKHKLITENIDKIEFPTSNLKKSSENYLEDFAFYGVSEIYPLKTQSTCVSEEKEAQKGSVELQNFKIKHAPSKNKEENFQMITEISDECETIDTCFANYASQTNESTKVMRNITTWHKAKFSTPTKTLL